MWDKERDELVAKVFDGEIPNDGTSVNGKVGHAGIYERGLSSNKHSGFQSKEIGKTERSFRALSGTNSKKPRSF